MKKPKAITQLEQLSNTQAVPVKFRAFSSFNWGWALIDKNWNLEITNNKWTSAQEIITIEPIPYWYNSGARWKVTFHHVTKNNNGFNFKIEHYHRLQPKWLEAAYKEYYSPKK